MSWLSVFFRKDSVQLILKLGVQILKMLIGKSAEQLQEIARQEVQRAETEGGTGLQKYEKAFKAIRARFPELKEAFINHAIETAVLALLAQKR